MITAEEFFRNKLKELQPFKEVITLANEMITAEQGMRWAHEFKQLHKPDVMESVCDWWLHNIQVNADGRCHRCEGTELIKQTALFLSNPNWKPSR